MSDQSLFSRVSSLVDEIENEKTAADQEKQGMKDPGGYEGPSSHPSTKSDEDELETPPEGEQSADNTKIVKEDIPESVDQQPEATPGNVPKSDDTQLGQGVDKAKATGEDASSEKDYKGKPTGDKRQGDMGGTSHPADGSYGDKYAQDLTTVSDEDLLKMAAELGNDVTADLAADVLTPEQAAQTPTEKAAAAGAQVAEAADQLSPSDVAAQVIEHQIKVAHHQADLLAGHLAWELQQLQEKAAEGEDPTGGEAEGEDHGSEEASEEPGAPPAEGGGEMPPADMGGGGGGEELLAAMGGGEPGPEMGMGGPEMGGEMGGMPAGGDLGGAPPELAGMGGDEGIQQLAMALLELGIDPAELAAAASDTGAKMASWVQAHKAAGKFRVESPQNKQQKVARDYMRSYVQELMKRN